MIYLVCLVSFTAGLLSPMLHGLGPIMAGITKFSIKYKGEYVKTSDCIAFLFYISILRGMRVLYTKCQDPSLLDPQFRQNTTVSHFT